MRRERYAVLLYAIVALSVVFVPAWAWTAPSPEHEAASSAAAFFKEGKYDQAIDSYTKAIEQDPRNADLYFKRAWVYHKRADRSRDDYASAARGYTETLALKPEYAPRMIYALRADAYLEAGDARAAIVDYTKAIELDPAIPNYRTDRANAYFKVGRYDEAKADYAKAIELDPDGKAGKVARDNLRILTEALKEKAAQPGALTQDEVTWLNTMEQEWGKAIDAAVPFIQQKNIPAANAHIKKAGDILSSMEALLIKKGYNVSALDRFVGMKLLTEVYANMAKIAAYTVKNRPVVDDLKNIQALFNDTRRKLAEAQAKFHEVPPLQELCRQFIAILDDFEREVRGLIR